MVPTNEIETTTEFFFAQYVIDIIRDKNKLNKQDIKESIDRCHQLAIFYEELKQERLNQYNQTGEKPIDYRGGDWVNG